MPKRSLLQQLFQLNQHIFLATDFLNKDYFQKAKIHILAGLNIQPNSSITIYLYSRYLKQKDNANWKEIEQKAYSLNPCFFEVLEFNNKNIYKSIMSSFKDSSQSFKQLSIKTGSKWIDLINTYSKSKDLDTCIKIMKIFDKIKLQDSQYTAHTFSTMGLSYYQAGCYQQAFIKYQSAINRLADQFRYYNNSAIIKYNMGQFQQSIELVHKSLQLKPNYAKSMFILSFGLAKIGKLDQSMNKIEAAIAQTSTSLLYRLKIITNLYLFYYQNKIEIVKKHLIQAKKIIQENTDQDSYFSCKENRSFQKQTIQFLLQSLQFKQINQEDFKSYVQRLDKYLICGHNDKFRNVSQMKIIKLKILQKNCKKQNKNVNNLPDELLLSQNIESN